ncbi:AraC family transcriptional regulator [Nonomuraea dietziae]|uniref:AraC-like DNA-binding protein n=1 Tax=Nonomuraea dietziae TaxID=65515 RepID=A0A7W5YD01_9ACTN|nr:AraC family transcriptional regulator [Nonomuraea dietziae]MBB3732966.1 AraC-like DNA-binding protein [Nonomuraea dietziae]
MDPVDDLLRTVRSEGAGVSVEELTPPRRLTGDAALTLLAPIQGVTELADSVVRVGETAIVRGPFTAHSHEHTVLLVAAYNVRGAVAHRLLDILPPMLVLPDGDDCTAMRDFLASQSASCASGQQVVLDRLLDWLLVCTLRAWFDQQPAAPVGWHDETLGPVLRAMHAAPGRPWTLAALADTAGVSRTTLAERFVKVVGTPPLTYLKDWRMTLAADLLAESTSTVAAVAHQVGYADAFGFSTAFKRFHGVNPTECRTACRT